MIARVTGTEGDDGSNDGEESDEGEESDGGEPSALEMWLEDQEIASNSEDCAAKFRMNVVSGSQNRRLFHGHDCGTELDYTLVSQIYLPQGTWGSPAVSDFSQSPDGATCTVEYEDIEKCEFSLPTGGEKLGIEFDSGFDLS